MTTKNETIKYTLGQTKERRKRQVCHVYELKVDRNRLTPACHDSLVRLFHEARWFYNAILGSGSIFTFDTKIRQVQVKTPDGYEPRDLTHLSSQMKQGLLSRIQGSIYALSSLKKKGKRVGRLKFKPIVASIPLKQHGNTYRIVGDHHVKIQNISEPLRVQGMEQLLGKEFANANLVQRSGDFYLMVTCYEEKSLEPEQPCPVAGIDFNIEAGSQMVLDCGIAIGFDVPVSNRIKQLSKKMARQDRANKRCGRSKHTTSRNKTKNKLQKAHRKATNIKTEIRRQVVHVLKTTFRVLCTQVESFKGWQRMWGKRILGTALAGIMQQLKTLPTTRFVERFVATTATCSRCHCRMENLPLDEKVFVCTNPDCRLTINRHVNAARNMIHHSGSERAGAPVEEPTSVCILWEKLSRLPHVRVSRLQ